jgi:photosystem II stability/assembly factor-like uncharacterized protein
VREAVRDSAAGVVRRALVVVPLALAIWFSPPAVARSIAASSWQIRSLASGSGIRIETVSPSSFYLLGEFGGSHEWVSQDGGVSGSIRNPGPPFAPDSVTSFSVSLNRQGAVTADGRLWVGERDGRDWEPLGVPDTLGTPSAVFCRQEEAFWIGTREGALVRVVPSPGSAFWTRVASLGDVPVSKIFPSGDDRLCLLLADGQLLSQVPTPSLGRSPERTADADSSWIEAPFRASHVDMARTGFGWSIEAGSQALWETSDGGEIWNRVGTALADPVFSPWLSQARRLLVRPDGDGVIACGDVLLATNDGGASWRIASSGAGMFLDASFDALGELMTAGAAIHRSTDRANSLMEVMGGDFSQVTLGSASTQWTLDRGLLLSVNQGERWLRQPIPDPAGRLTRIAARGDYEIWLHFDGETSPRTFYSDDRGGSYAEIDPAGLLGGMRGWVFPAPGIGWAYRDSTILRSVTDGTDWQVARIALEPIVAMAARDSLEAAFTTRARFLLTHDGGETWTEWESPAAAGTRSVCLADSDRLVAAGRGIALLQTAPVWETLSESSLPETLRAVAILPDHTGWAVGDGGLLAGTTDDGATWEPYRVNLELNAFQGDLTSLSALDSAHAVTGSGNLMIRLLPDGNAPIFRFGITVNPYLSRYLDIHVTARERLRGDSLFVSVDGEPLDASLFDPEGFFYRVRYQIPSESAARRMTTRGLDWAGNERVDIRTIQTLILDASGDGALVWDDGGLAIHGPGDGAIEILELSDEVPPFPDDPVWGASGRPFQIAADRGLVVNPDRPGSALAVWVPDDRSGAEDLSLTRRDGGSGAWMFPTPQDREIPPGSIVLPLRNRTAPLPGIAQGASLRLFPLPARDTYTLEWTSPLRSLFRWELLDINGRRLAHGETTSMSANRLRLQTRDGEGRSLPSGVYWIRVEEGPARAVRRLLVVR